MTDTEKQIVDMGYEIRVIDMLNNYVVYENKKENQAERQAAYLYADLPLYGDFTPDRGYRNVFSGCPCRLSADLLSTVLFWNDHFTDVL